MFYCIMWSMKTTARNEIIGIFKVFFVHDYVLKAIEKLFM